MRKTRPTTRTASRMKVIWESAQNADQLCAGPFCVGGDWGRALCLDMLNRMLWLLGYTKNGLQLMLPTKMLTLMLCRKLKAETGVNEEVECWSSGGGTLDSGDCVLKMMKRKMVNERKIARLVWRIENDLKWRSIRTIHQKAKNQSSSQTSKNIDLNRVSSYHYYEELNGEGVPYQWQ